MRTEKPYPYHYLRDRAKKAAHRQAALAELAAGETVAEVSRRYGVSRQTLYSWQERAEENDGQVILRARARPFKLAPEHWPELAELVRGTPRAAGLDCDFWSLARLAELIRARFGVEYSPTAVSRLMKRLGFSPQKPERRARERNEQAISHWKQTVLPEVEKKGGRGRAARGRR